MADQDMRLRLIVRRHGLPEARLMWSVRLDNDSTISKLLEHLDKSVPLESDDWGLEDYAVELRDDDGTAFECLHYQLVRDVLKPDDRVFIRVLERDDHRRRRASGRDQISIDGRHLIDGVPFGRPRLRSPVGRPSVHIPPRKRPRLAYHQPDSKTLLLTNGEPSYLEHDPVQNDEEQEDDEDDETDDSDYAHASEPDEDISSSDDDLNNHGRDENDAGNSAPAISDDEDLHQEARHLAKENFTLDPRNAPKKQPSITDKLSALRAAFPGAPIDVCERVLATCEGNLDITYLTMADAFTPYLSKKNLLSANVLQTSSTGNVEKSPTETSAAGATDIARELGNGPAEEEEEEDEDDEPEEEDSELIRKYDHAGFPPGTISSGKGLSHMATVSASFANSKTNGASETTSTTLKPSPKTTNSESDNRDSDSDSDDSGSESDSSSNEDSRNDAVTRKINNTAQSLASKLSDSSSEDGASDNDGEDSGPEEAPIAHSASRGLTSDTDSSDSSSDSNSEDNRGSSSDSEDSIRDESIVGHDAKLPATANNLQPDKSPSPETVQPRSISMPVPPGAGKRAAKKAQKVEQVRREQTTTETGNAVQNHDTSAQVELRDTSKGQSPFQPLDQEALLFEAKRSALLAAIASGGVEVGPSGDVDLGHASVGTPSEKRKRSDELDAEEGSRNGSVAGATPKEVVGETPSSTASQKRRRVDVNAGRRLLFDEDELRDKLTLEARLLPSNNVSQRQVPATETSQEDISINYRAVECCDEGIELSPAPFPFQMRWDPQQQGSFKQALRNQPHFYQDESSVGKKRRRVEPGAGPDAEYEDTVYSMNDDGLVLNYDDPEPEGQQIGEEPKCETSQATDLDDLPSLPADVSELLPLRPGQAQIGMVITWQKWSCSSATNWQPQVSRVTAIIVRIDHEDAALEVCLAKRDRHLDSQQKRYDDRTGKRIYDKFEAPDLDEDSEGMENEDEGFRTVLWSEMQDPRVLQQPQDLSNDLEPESDIEQPKHIIQSIEDTAGHDDHNVTDIDPAKKAVSPTSGQPELSSNSKPVNPGSTAGTDSTSNSTSHQAGQGPHTADRVMSDTSQINSPSQQLHETSSQALEVSQISIGAETTQEQTEPTMQRNRRPIIPSSPGSVQSGRQRDFVMDMDVDHIPDSYIATTDEPDRDMTPLPGPSQPLDSISSPATPKAKATDTTDLPNTPGKAQTPSAPTSSGSLCSLNEVWCTAQTSRNTQSPPKAHPIIPSMSQALRDPAESDDDFRPTSSIPTKPHKAMGKSSTKVKIESAERIPARKIKEEQVENWEEENGHSTATKKISPPPPRRSSRQPFSIPSGSQVFEISSDSDDSPAVENYADEDVDETYSPRLDRSNSQSSLPKGGGWVAKRRNRPTRSSSALGALVDNAMPTASLPATSSSQPTGIGSSQASHGARSRRKISARF
ncbi:hypothetical protein GGR57DRAFT_492300 [Xylariaceae sp. FL1272]|nr:hypothetical protein GGR57DRAFT_492300 [Xylariaceae sp. FL1272]